MADEAGKLSLIDRIKGFYNGVKAEYSKIIFPNQETIKKQTTAVVFVSVLIGVLIFVIDLVFKYLMGFIL